MSRTLSFAVIQMDATPAPVPERLARAEKLVEQAAQQGTQIVVLPELFNTGYHYHDANYAAAEPMGGQTANWMRAQAVKHKIHLAGTFLLLDGDDIYNSALLFAPDEEWWRYDKNYPWLYERAYFREGQGITIAETELGKFGMLICWDAAHPDLWQRYAGKIDAMLVMSCPPDMANHDIVFEDGERVHFSDVMPGLHSDFPANDLDAQAGWLGVPVAATVGAGTFRSHVPLPGLMLRGALNLRPDLWGKVTAETEIEAGYYVQQTKIVDAAGRVLTRVETDSDGVAVTTVTLPDVPPVPQGEQPSMNTSPLTYAASDVIGPSLLVQVYRAGVRRYWGARMAPVDTRTKLWAGVIAVIAAVSFLVGWGMRRR